MYHFLFRKKKKYRKHVTSAVHRKPTTREARSQSDTKLALRRAFGIKVFEGGTRWKKIWRADLNGRKRWRHYGFRSTEGITALLYARYKGRFSL